MSGAARLARDAKEALDRKESPESCDAKAALASQAYLAENGLEDLPRHWHVWVNGLNIDQWSAVQERATVYVGDYHTREQ